MSDMGVWHCGNIPGQENRSSQLSKNKSKSSLMTFETIHPVSGTVLGCCYCKKMLG